MIALDKPYRVRVVSDLHVGSRWGLWPERFEADGESFSQNRYNRWLWKNWQHLVSTYPPVDCLIVNGDTVDGDAPKDRGAGVKTTESDIQQLAAVEVLRPLVARAHKWYLVRGTAYHERWFAAIADSLGAARWENGDRSGQVLDLTIKHLTFNFAHHPESGAVLYRGTALDKTGLWSIIAAATGHVPDAQVVVRSHHHHYDLLQSNGRTIITTPGWQLQTPHMKKLAYFRYQPDFGAVDILVSADEPDPTVIPIRYKLARKKAIRVA